MGLFVDSGSPIPGTLAHYLNPGIEEVARVATSCYALLTLEDPGDARPCASDPAMHVQTSAHGQIERNSQRVQSIMVAVPPCASS
jgi:hypothetical protein